MKTNIPIKILLYLSLILIFFKAFYIPVGFSHYLVLFFILVPLYIFVMVFTPKTFLKQLKLLYIKTPFKYLVWFIIYVIISSLILCMMGTYPVTRLLRHLPMGILFYLLPCYLLSAYFIPKYVSFEKVIKIIEVMVFVILIWGIIEFIAKIFHINILVNIVDFFSNLEFLRHGEVRIITEKHSNMPRIKSLCSEASTLGNYLLIFFPIIFYIIKLKPNLFKNKFIDIFLKYSLLPLWVINLLLIRSPMTIVLILVFVVFYFGKKIIKYIKGHLTQSVILLLLLLMYICTNNVNIDVSDNYLSRIINTIKTFGNFTMFVIVEPSLAARIVSYINTMIIFMKHFFLGAGWGNVAYFMSDQFLKSPVPLSYENYFSAVSLSPQCPYNRAPVYQLLSETGLIGFLFYSLFIYKTFKFLNKIKLFYINTPVLNNFIQGLKGSYLAIIINHFYNSNLLDTCNLFLLGLTASLAVSYYYDKNKGM